MVHSIGDHMKDRPGGWHTFDPRLARDGNAVTCLCVYDVGVSNGCLLPNRSNGV